MQRGKGVKETNLKKKDSAPWVLWWRAHNSTPIIVRGDGLQVCLTLPKEVGDRKF